MVQNHILQVVALLAMEPPVAFSEKEIRTEKIKALKAIRIYNEEEVLENFVRGNMLKVNWMVYNSRAIAKKTKWMLNQRLKHSSQAIYYP